MVPDEITQSFADVVRWLGLSVRFHDLRHGNASQLGRMGVPTKVIGERLGHSSVTITLDVYSHVLPGMHPEGAARMDSALRAAGVAFGAAAADAT